MPYTRNADFAKYYDTNLKRNYWVLGYFGGGAINIADAYSICSELSNEINVPIGSIHIDEILKSSRYKHFKIIYSIQENQTPEEDAYSSENVWGLLSM